MGIIGGALGYKILKLVGKPDDGADPSGAAYDDGTSKLEALLGRGFWREIQGKTVVDFGCGPGELAAREGVADRCTFTASPAERAEVIVSTDAFEHFDDPPAILKTMRDLLL